MASGSIISEPPPENGHGVQPEAADRDQAPQPLSVRTSGPMDIDLLPSEKAREALPMNMLQKLLETCLWERQGILLLLNRIRSEMWIWLLGMR